jgi:ElaA protein
MDYQFSCKHFKDLTSTELYALLSLRSEVFIVEQRCAFQDLDFIDQLSWHIMVTDSEGKISALSRIIPAGKLYTECSIGRVCTRFSERNTGLGKALMHFSMVKCHELLGKQPIKIMAQEYLQLFYESFGFKQTSEPFTEDGILHIYMHWFPAG